MQQTGVVRGDLCSLASVGDPDPALIPAGVAVGVGRAGPYTCLIW
jgi:hypothetical protein